LLQALQFLREQGFQNLKSVKGGINAWANEIDRTVPRC
jgi:rhodanese-related sulfurtransferase